MECKQKPSRPQRSRTARKSGPLGAGIPARLPRRHPIGRIRSPRKKDADLTELKQRIRENAANQKAAARAAQARQKERTAEMIGKQRAHIREQQEKQEENRRRQKQLIQEKVV